MPKKKQKNSAKLEEERNKQRVKLDKITSFWKRTNPKTSKNSIKIHIKPLKTDQIIPVELINLILKFSEYFCSFDIFESKYTTRTSHQSHDSFTIDNLPLSNRVTSSNTFLVNSKPIKITDSVKIKLIHQPDTAEFTIYMGLKNLQSNHPQFGNWMAVVTNNTHGALETFFYNKHRYVTGTSFNGLKNNDIMQIKRTKYCVKWLKNNKVECIQSLHPENPNIYYFWVKIQMGSTQKYWARRYKLKLANESFKFSIY